VPQKLLTGARTEGLRAVRVEARTSRARATAIPPVPVHRGVAVGACDGDTARAAALRHFVGLRR
jgi:hypothetical protein